MIYRWRFSMVELSEGQRLIVEEMQRGRTLQVVYGANPSFARLYGGDGEATTVAIGDASVLLSSALIDKEAEGRMGEDLSLNYTQYKLTEFGVAWRPPVPPAPAAPARVGRGFPTWVVPAAGFALIASLVFALSRC
jgi:hypothetical protein